MQPSSDKFEPPLFFVINDGSGRQNTSATRQTIDFAMRSAGRRYRIFVIDGNSGPDATIKNAVATAKEASGAVVAVGGDGTINGVATAALAQQCLFGAVPQGTFNYFGRTHNIPEDIESALQDLLLGKPVPVQVGLVNDRVFLVNASVGFYPELLEDREVFKQRYGRSRLVALWAAVVTAFGSHRHLDMSLEQGGKRVNFRTTTLFIGNNRLQLEQVGMPQAEAVKQGQLAAIAIKPVGTMAMLWLAAHGALGRLGNAENVTGFSFRSLTVAPLRLLQGKRSMRQTEGATAKVNRRKHRIKVAVDGEIMWLNAPLEFRVSPEQLLLIKPSHESDSNNQINGSLSGDSLAESQRALQARMKGDAT